MINYLALFIWLVAIALCFRLPEIGLPMVIVLGVINLRETRNSPSERELKEEALSKYHRTIPRFKNKVMDRLKKCDGRLTYMVKLIVLTMVEEYYYLLVHSDMSLTCKPVSYINELEIRVRAFEEYIEAFHITADERRYLPIDHAIRSVVKELGLPDNIRRFYLDLDGMNLYNQGILSKDVYRHKIHKAYTRVLKRRFFYITPFFGKRKNKSVRVSETYCTFEPLLSAVEELNLCIVERDGIYFIQHKE